jgi:hypothetical protein
MTNMDESKLSKWVQSLLRSLRSKLQDRDNEIKRLKELLKTPSPDMSVGPMLIVSLADIVRMYKYDQEDDCWEIHFSNGVIAKYTHASDVADAWVRYRRDKFNRSR